MECNTEYLHNIGKVIFRDDICFWTFSRAYLMVQRNSLIHSPYFYYLSEKWRLALRFSAYNSYMTLYLWRESYKHPSNCSFAVELKLETPDGRRIGYAEGDLIHDYGFEAEGICVRDDAIRCKFIKIVVEIKEKYDNGALASVGTPDGENNQGLKNEDEASSDEASSDEDEASSDEDEASSNEENIQKKRFEDKGIKKLIENLTQVLIDERMTDAILKVENREFKVHKVILVARSPVFASMFEHDMMEKKDNAVDIPDCTAEAFEAFLHYIYCGKIKTLSASNVCNVYYAADKYHVDDLKEKCVKFMIKNMSVETFCDVIALSLRHGETKLQKNARDFFCQNIKKIVKTVQWQKYMHESSTEANELLIKALNA